MVQNDSWEWLLTGFKIDLETQVKPKTVKDYCDHVSYFARWAEHNGKGTPYSITKRDIQEFLHYIASSPAIFTTGNGAKRIVQRDENSRWHYYFPLKRFFTWTVDEGYLMQNPIDTIMLKPPKAAPIEPNGAEHIDAFLKILEHEWKVATTTLQKMLSARNRAILSLLLDSFIRLEECYHLKIGDIDLSKKRVLVRKCRENVLKTVEKQNTGIAERLGLKELHDTNQVKFASTEESLQKELEAAGQLLDSVTNELRAKKISPTEELRKDLGLLEKAVADREKGAKDKLLSPVDPYARQGKKSSATWPGYKAHIVIEEETGIITGVETTPANATDGSQLQPLLKEQEKAHSIKTKELTGDKAYDWGENLEVLNSNKTIANISLSKQVNRNGAGYFTVDDFLYDPESVKLMCPAGHISASCYREILYNNKPGYAFHFKPSLCNVCPLKAKCVKNRAGRRVYISYYEPYYRLARQRMATEEGKQAYRNRYKIEQKMADLTRYCGLRRCRYRGLDRAGIHTLLATTVCNIKQMVKLLWGKPDNYYLESPAAG